MSNIPPNLAIAIAATKMAQINNNNMSNNKTLPPTQQQTSTSSTSTTQFNCANKLSKGGPRGGIYDPFPSKLHRMLDEIASEGLDHIVGWMPHGRSIKIHKPKEFADLIMHRYFNQSKYTSFQRQLNLYGFQRKCRGPDVGSYHHPYFLRGYPTLAMKIVRTKIKGANHKTLKSFHEPDLYAMPPLGGIIEGFRQIGPSVTGNNVHPAAVNNVHPAVVNNVQTQAPQQILMKPMAMGTVAPQSTGIVSLDPSNYSVPSPMVQQYVQQPGMFVQPQAYNNNMQYPASILLSGQQNRHPSALNFGSLSDLSQGSIPTNGAPNNELATVFAALSSLRRGANV